MLCRAFNWKGSRSYCNLQLYTLELYKFFVTLFLGMVKMQYGLNSVILIVKAKLVNKPVPAI